jgi:hypothetical protein
MATLCLAGSIGRWATTGLAPWERTPAVGDNKGTNQSKYHYGPNDCPNPGDPNPPANLLKNCHKDEPIPDQSDVHNNPNASKCGNLDASKATYTPRNDGSTDVKNNGPNCVLVLTPEGADAGAFVTEVPIGNTMLATCVSFGPNLMQVNVDGQRGQIGFTGNVPATGEGAYAVPVC